MKKSGLIILLVTIILSCNSDDNQEPEVIEKVIFGEIYGQCAGDCRNLYLLTEQGIYEDSNSDTDFGDFIDNSDWENTTFENQPLSMEKFELAKQLLQFPNILLESNDEITEQVLADFDYFIEIKTNKTSKTWVFDKIKETADIEIKQYMEDIVDVNNQLRD
jgi:hypothetical protein